MIPGNVDLKKHYKGDTYKGVTFIIKNKDTGDPIDLTGASAKCQFRNLSGKVLIELTSGDGLTISTPTNGQITIEPFIIDWNPGTYKFDLQLIFTGNIVQTYVRGVIDVIGDTTR